MKTTLVISMSVILCALIVGQVQAADPEWYTIKFSETDLWNYNPGYDSSVTSAVSQEAPRRHHDSWKDSGITSTWLYGDGLPAGTEGGTVDTTYQQTYVNAGDTGFGGWAAGAAGQAYAITNFNLWGADFGNAVNLFGEKFIVQGDASDHGISSWQILATPTGWTGSVVENEYTSDQGVARWDTTGGGITQANADPNQFFEVAVLIANPETAFESDGSLRVWFGDWKGGVENPISNAGLDGVITVPEPGTLTLLGLAGLIGLATAWIRRRQSSG